MAGRKRPAAESKNPLFVQWLGEWLDKEREKDTNFKFVLQKAYTNMQEFPEVLASGKDAMRVRGIGAKLADMLDRKMKQVGASSGAGPVTGQTLGSSQGPPPSQASYGPGPASSQSFGSAPAPKPAPKKRKQAPAGGGAEGAEPGQQPPKKKRQPKPYVPEYRSGAYALLVTLYLEKYGPSKEDCMLKADLMRKAEAHCNSSFTEASDKNGYYTAWSAMTMLRDKGLVCKTGNPAAYALTEPDGESLARACVELGRRQQERDDGPGSSQRAPGPGSDYVPHAAPAPARPGPVLGDRFIRTEDLGSYLASQRTNGAPSQNFGQSDYGSGRSTAPNAPSAASKSPLASRKAPPSDGPICLDSDSDDGNTVMGRGTFGQAGGSLREAASAQGLPSSQPHHQQPPGKRFQFDYMDEDRPTLSKEQAAVKIGGGGALLLRIRFHIKQSGHPFIMSNVLERSMVPVESFLFGWLRDENAPPQAPGIDLEELLTPQAAPTAAPAKAPRAREPPRERGPAPPPDYGVRTVHGQATNPEPVFARTNSGSVAPSASGAASASSAATLGRSSAPVGQSSFQEFTGSPIRLARGTYDIVLVLDCRESKTKTYAAVQERDWMLERLYSRGIKTEKRVLELGDMCWIARPRGSQGTGDEIALDYVIERKALDDLKISIHEGRFEEQKFRLANCGVQNVVYVIEGLMPRSDPAWAEHLKKMYSAMSLLQVGHGFFVKQTLNKEDTLNFLANMTLWIQQVYMTEDIHAIPADSLQKATWRDVRLQAQERDGRRYHLTFASFNELNAKTRNHVLRDAFVKQLLCIRGISVEKAVAIAAKYPTMRSLLDSLSRESGDDARVKMLMAVSDASAPTRRKIGKAVAVRMVEVLCVQQPRPRPPPADDEDL